MRLRFKHYEGEREWGMVVWFVDLQLWDGLKFFRRSDDSKNPMLALAWWLFDKVNRK